MDGGADRDQGDEGSGMSDSGGSPKRPHALGSGTNDNDEVAGPSSRGRASRRGQAGACTDAAEDAEDERARRRREINRNSQKRIRERRNKEMDELRLEAQRLSSENEALLRQVEALTLARADMLRQVQDLTDKWQQSIAENAWLNRENIQLRNAVQQFNALFGGSNRAPGSIPTTTAVSPSISAAATRSMPGPTSNPDAPATMALRGQSDPRDQLSSLALSLAAVTGGPGAGEGAGGLGGIGGLGALDGFGGMGLPELASAHAARTVARSGSGSRGGGAGIPVAVSIPGLPGGLTLAAPGGMSSAPPIGGLAGSALGGLSSLGGHGGHSSGSDVFGARGLLGGMSDPGGLLSSLTSPLAGLPPQLTSLGMLVQELVQQQQPQHLQQQQQQQQHQQPELVLKPEQQAARPPDPR